MKLGDLIKGVIDEYPQFGSTDPSVNTKGLEDLEILGITDDSRRVKPGFFFVAVKGLQSDGHEYIQQAVSGGAMAVVFDVNLKSQISNLKLGETLMIPVENTRKALGLLWAAWYGFPSKKLKVIGVTGTDGKTTTTNLIYHVLKSAGRKVGMISTINARIGSKEIDTGFHVTNPEPELLQKLLSEMVKEKIEYAVVEVTSHGIDQERVAGLDFFGAAITNVTHEHLDYHKTFKEYLETKGKLFKNVNFGVLNWDDGSYDYLSRAVSGRIVSYSIKGKADIFARSIELTGGRSRFLLSLEVSSTSPLHCGEVKLGMPGSYNVSNALAATGVCWELGLTLGEIVKGLESFEGLEGRFEEIRMDQPFRVIVDFAHTPNALEQVLELSSKFKAPTSAEASAGRQNSKLIVVFGGAGERDKEKRSMMGEIAGRLADVSVLTAEDPRREDLTDIINSISAGCLRGGADEIFNFPARIDTRSVSGRQFSIFNSGKEPSAKHYFVKIPDRREAIAWALGQAKKDDVVLITGKGHEKSMCFGTTEYPWSDQAVARQALSGLGFGKKRK